jgi:hypothetical protein
MSFLSGFYFFCFVIFAVSVWGQTPSAASAVNPLLTPQETELRQKAKKRIYPGGRDEESLTVQTQLTAPVRKQSPASEAAPDEEPETPTDHD